MRPASGVFGSASRRAALLTWGHGSTRPRRALRSFSGLGSPLQRGSVAVPRSVAGLVASSVVEPACRLVRGHRGTLRHTYLRITRPGSIISWA